MLGEIQFLVRSVGSSDKRLIHAARGFPIALQLLNQALMPVRFDTKYELIQMADEQPRILRPH